jgi:hypothetical protein
MYAHQTPHVTLTNLLNDMPLRAAILLLTPAAVVVWPSGGEIQATHHNTDTTFCCKNTVQHPNEWTRLLAFKHVGKCWSGNLSTTYREHLHNPFSRNDSNCPGLFQKQQSELPMHLHRHCYAVE